MLLSHGIGNQPTPHRDEHKKIQREKNLKSDTNVLVYNNKGLISKINWPKHEAHLKQV